MKTKNLKYLSVILVGLLVTSCVSDPNFKSYVLADRLDYDAQAPHYLSLVEANMPATNEFEKAQKEAIKRRVEQKGRTLLETEKYLGIK